MTYKLRKCNGYGNLSEELQNKDYTELFRQFVDNVQKSNLFKKTGEIEETIWTIFKCRGKEEERVIQIFRVDKNGLVSHLLPSDWWFTKKMKEELEKSTLKMLDEV